MSNIVEWNSNHASKYSQRPKRVLFTEHKLNLILSYTPVDWAGLITEKASDEA